MAIKPEGGTAALMNKSNVISNSRYDPLEGAVMRVHNVAKNACGSRRLFCYQHSRG
jgi:hypothetical protein